MSPLDISVLFFFVLIISKALRETFEFWRQIDEEAVINMKLSEAAHTRINMTNKKPERVTRTSARPSEYPYCVCHVDTRESVKMPAPIRRNEPVMSGAGRQISNAA